jgi:hypothetical protein
MGVIGNQNDKQLRGTLAFLPQKRGFVDFGRFQECAKKIFHVENGALDWRPEEGITRFLFSYPAQEAYEELDVYSGLKPHGKWFQVTPDQSRSAQEIGGILGGIMGGLSMDERIRTEPRD